MVKAWHNLLMDYVKDTKNITCGIRYGNGRQTLESGEKGDDSLRRGWLTKNKKDNPSLEEFKNWLLDDDNNKISENTYRSYRSALKSIFRLWSSNFEKNRKIYENKTMTMQLNIGV